MNENTLTTSNGTPVCDNQNSLTVGPVKGPVLLQDFHLIDKLFSFDRERIPERVVNAKGAGAHGYFEVTNDVTNYCKANFLSEIGKRTPIFARFSCAIGEKGSSDMERDLRGFSVKFYTEEGNYDLVANSSPVYFIRDAIKFPDLIHALRKHPQSNYKDPTSAWDFWSLMPESTHSVMMLFSDRGIPYGYRHMNGYGVHTYKWYNKDGESYWVKMHLISQAGIKNFDVNDSELLKKVQPDFATRDLFDYIQQGGKAEWKMYVQCMPYDDAWKYRFSPFDATKVWYHSDYPLIEVGKLVLDRNPANYFAEVEQVAFSPSHMVPGIEPSPDKLLQGRLISYLDSQNHRLGGNYRRLPINCPYRSRINNYQRDGQFIMDDGGGSRPNYEPNSFMGPLEDEDFKECPEEITGVVGRWDQYNPNEDFEQPGEFYRRVLNEDEKLRLIRNIVESLGQVKIEDIKIRAVRNFYRSDEGLGTKLCNELNLNIRDIVRGIQ